MIPRYSTKEMTAIWSDSAKHQLWFKIELLALKAMAEEGTVPKDAYDKISNKVVFKPERIEELENETKHDVIAFVTSLTEQVGAEGRYLHLGMTSSDLVDTAFCYQLKESANIIEKALTKLIDTLMNRAVEHKLTACIGRTHGMHAEPTTFGLKLLTFVAEFKRRLSDFISAKDVISVGTISGPVGTYANINPSIENKVLRELGLKADEISTQVINRDRHAKFFLALAQIGASLERLAVELRHLQRTEVSEVEEGFSKGQKGSSSMPHKKNPISSENITGVARLLRGYAFTALENVALWHERDISHSATERVIGPDACHLTHYSLERMTGIIENLVVKADKMKENLELSKGAFFSGTLLNELVKGGMSREASYKFVQSCAFEAKDKSVGLVDIVKSRSAEVKDFISDKIIDQSFSLDRHYKNIDLLFERNGKYGAPSFAC